MEQLMMLNLMQTPSDRKMQTGTKSSDPEGFQKLMEQSQDSAPASDAKPSGAPKADSPEAKDAPEAAGDLQKPVQDDPELEKQMVLAAMAMLQNPVVPVEQVMTPPEEAAVETVGTVEAMEILPVEAEAVVAEELPLDVEPEAAETVETVTDAPAGAPEETAEPVEDSVEPLKAPEAAGNAGEPKDLEAEVQDGDGSKPETEEKVEVQEGMAERPVFEDVREVPVKVGEAPAAAKDEPVENQISRQLTEALNQGETKVEIQLTPDNLGKIRVEVTIREDGGLLVQLHAENSHTQNLLEKNLSGLEALLSRDRQQEVQVEVPRQQESQQQQNLFDQQQKEQQRQQQQQRREQPQNSEDFLQQLRLGLIPTDGEM